MKTSWLRHARMLAGLACVALLGACGASSIESQLSPSRIIVFGDAFSDMGNAGGARYTVNNGSVNNWALRVANNYRLPLATSSTGGTNYAVGNARVILKPDAAGNAATATIKEQVDAFLAADRPGSRDVVLVSGGVSDIVVQASAYLANTQDLVTTQNAVSQAGTDFAAQVRRLVNAGGSHVVIVGSYNVGRTPWAIGLGQRSLLENLTRRFNDALLIAVADLGANALYVDVDYYFNLVTGSPSSYSLTNATAAVCTSVDSTTPAPGPIGVGANQVSSLLCDGTTLGGQNADRFAFADPLYPTPELHRLFGDYAEGRIKTRW